MDAYFLWFQDPLQIFAPNGSHEKKRPKAITAVRHYWFNAFQFRVFYINDFNNKFHFQGLVGPFKSACDLEGEHFNS